MFIVLYSSTKTLQITFNVRTARTSSLVFNNACCVHLESLDAKDIFCLLGKKYRACQQEMKCWRPQSLTFWISKSRVSAIHEVLCPWFLKNVIADFQVEWNVKTSPLSGLVLPTSVIFITNKLKMAKLSRFQNFVRCSDWALQMFLKNDLCCLWICLAIWNL